MKKVSDDDRFLAIAKRCGWYDIQVNLSESKTGYIGMHPNIPSYAYNIPYQGYDKHGAHRSDYGTAIPDYLHSLDAMHRAEKYLDDKEWMIYTDILYKKLACSDMKRGDIHASGYDKACAYYTVIASQNGK